MGFPTRITSVDGQTGTVDLTKADVGLANVDNTSDADKPVSTAQLTAIRDRSNEVISSTWANRATAISAIAALTPAEGYVRITDIGPNGSLWWCNGVKLIRDTSVVLAELTVGVILPSLVAANLATYSQTGTTITVDNTIGHNIPATTFNGNSVYLTPSSGTLVEGIFTNFQRTGANTFTCESTISQTISGNLASTTGQKILASFTIPAALLGATGRFETTIESQVFNSSNNKTITGALSGVTYYTVSVTTVGRKVVIAGMRNKNATNVQQATCNDTSTGLSTNTGTLLVGTVDTTANTTVTLRGTVAAANEFLCIEHSSFSVYPS